MTRPICAITGATGGIGAALSLKAAQAGYDLILHGRSETKLSRLQDSVETAVPESKAELVIGGLETSSGAYGVAEAISAHAPKLDLLVNNAGVLLDGIQMSPDGLEMHTQINLIAPYILMQSLKTNVAKAAGTIVNVASGSALRAKALSVHSLRRPEKAQKLFGAYAQSKLALVVMTQALGAVFAADRVTLAAVDPGPNKTAMTQGEGMPTLLRLLRPLIYASPEKGASRVLEIANSAHLRDRPGAFYVRSREKALPDFATEHGVASEILSFCKASTNVSESVQPISAWS